jgi:Family of unknown function (DUF6338)
LGSDGPEWACKQGVFFGTADDRPGASRESVRPDADAQADCARKKACKSELRTQTFWDFAFDHEQDLLLVIELKDGSRVAGYYGPRSHSGYGTRTRDLFLEERWEISRDDGSMSRPPAERHSVGVWIDADEIRLGDHYAMSDEHKADIEKRSPERS